MKILCFVLTILRNNQEYLFGLDSSSINRFKKKEVTNMLSEEELFQQLKHVEEVFKTKSILLLV